MVNKVAKGGANAVLEQKGMVRHGHRGYGRDVGLIVHMSASTSLGPDPNNKVQVCLLVECLKMGADAVSVHINIGSETESDQLSILGWCLSERCDFWGMPLTSHDVPARQRLILNPNDVEVVAHAARAGAELGADIVKTNYTGDIDSSARGGGLSCACGHRRRGQDRDGHGVLADDRRGHAGRVRVVWPSAGTSSSIMTL